MKTKRWTKCGRQTRQRQAIPFPVTIFFHRWSEHSSTTEVRSQAHDHSLPWLHVFASSRRDITYIFFGITKKKVRLRKNPSNFPSNSSQRCCTGIFREAKRDAFKRLSVHLGVAVREKMAGRISLLVMAEPQSRFPQKGHLSPPNLVVRAAKSHIMTVSHRDDWLETYVSIPSNPPDLVLLLDAWTPFRNHAAIQDTVPPGRSLTIFDIPPGCTSICQPADVYFFSPL